MSAQQGFEYEKNVAKILKEFGLVPKTFTPAGASHDQPDLLLEHRKKQAGCELKISAASAGSLVLKYNKSGWGFGTISADDKEKQFIVSLAYKVKLFDIIKKTWKETPYKRELTAQEKAIIDKIPPAARYKRDLELFKDIRGEIPATEIEKYYNTKKTYYVNVGTHGFYLMGSTDPLQLNRNLQKTGMSTVPTFGSSASAIYRARVQYKGSNNYQFTFEMMFSIQKKSAYNIGPITGKSVEIDKSKLNISCFI
jgi:hypothetical protein